MIRLLLLLCLIASPAAAARAELVVIVHPQSPLDRISDSELARIFLSKTKYLPNGERAHPAELASAESKNRFYLRVAGKREVELRQYWATMIFTGHGQPPKQLRTIEDIIQYVVANPGAIAYVPSESLDDSVNIVDLVE